MASLASLRARALSAAVAVALAAGCGGSSGSKSGAAAPPGSGGTNPVAAPAPRPSGTGATVAVGAPADLGDGITVVVSNLTLSGDSKGSWLQIKLKAQNRGTVSTTNPQASIICSADPRAGGWQAQSSYKRYDQLAAGKSVEGTLNLLLPGDDRGGGTLPLTCTVPAVVRIYRLDGEKTSDVPIPDDIVSRLVKRSATGG